MKLVFLDVDFVLNRVNCPVKLKTGIYFVLDEKIQLLKKLVTEEKGVEIVLSSSWRQGWADLDAGKKSQHADDFIALREKLREFGLELLSYTPDLPYPEYDRGDEIDLWLKSWDGEPIESFVILDDMGGRHLRPHAGRLVQTSVKGLLPKHIARAKKILERPYTKEEGNNNE